MRCDPKVASLTAGLAGVAAFSKSFVPFHFFGSTEIFAVAVALAILGVLLDWRAFWWRISNQRTMVFLVALLFGLATINFIFLSRDTVPDTYLIGMIGFSSLFLLLGIAASMAFRSVLIILLCMAVIYFCYCLSFLVENGALYVNERFGDVFDLQNWEFSSGTSITQLYQNVGTFLGLGALSFWFLSERWSHNVRVVSAIVVVSAFLAIIIVCQARGAAVGLIIASTISMNRRQFRSLLIVAAAAALILLPIVVIIDIEHLPIIQKTMNEIQSPQPGTRLSLLKFVHDQISNFPDIIWFGRGLGMFPVDLGAKAPDWILSSNAASVYPHNPVIEAFYELGIFGVLVSLAVILAPIAAAWTNFERCRCEMSFYLFVLSIDLTSGSLAYSYFFYFIYGVTLGKISDLGSESSRTSESNQTVAFV